MQFLSQSQLQLKLDEISDELDAWVDETDGKFDIDTFFFEYFDGFEIEPNGNTDETGTGKTRKMKNALKRAKFFAPFAFKPNDKDCSTFWNYIAEIGNEYLDHCSSEDIMLLREQHLDINAPEDIGYVLFRREYNNPLESYFYNDETDALELQVEEEKTHYKLAIDEVELRIDEKVEQFEALDAQLDAHRKLKAVATGESKLALDSMIDALIDKKHAVYEQIKELENEFLSLLP